MTMMLTSHDLGALRPVPRVSDWLPVTCPDTAVTGTAGPGVIGSHEGASYTVDPAAPRWLRASDPDSGALRPDRDIPLGPTPLPLRGIRGGLITPHARVLLVAAEPNAVFCFDLLRVPGQLAGVCTGARLLPEVPGAASGLVLRACWCGGEYTPLHLLTTHGSAYGLTVPEPIEL